MSRLMSAARDRLDDFKPSFGAIRTGRLVGHDGVMLEADGLDLPLGASARIAGSLAQASDRE